MWATGWNIYGQIGDGWWIAYRTRFVQVVSGGVKAIAAGYAHSLIMQHNGTVWATGWNKHGQLGDGSSLSRSAMVTSGA